MFSDNSVKKIFKKNGALRINKKAIKKFKRIIDKYSKIITRKAIKNAEYAGRKTIKGEDVEE